MLLELVQVGTRYGVRATIERDGTKDLVVWYDRDAKAVTDVRHIRSKCLFGSINRPTWVFNALKRKSNNEKPVGPIAGDSITVLQTFEG